MFRLSLGRSGVTLYLCVRGTGEGVNGGRLACLQGHKHTFILSERSGGREDGQPTKGRRANVRGGAAQLRTWGACASGQDSPTAKREKIRTAPTELTPHLDSDVGFSNGLTCVQWHITQTVKTPNKLFVSLDYGYHNREQASSGVCYWVCILRP